MFVTRVDISSGDISWTRFLGGSDLDEAGNRSPIAIDIQNNILVVGNTRSLDMAASNVHFGGTWDSFVAKLSADGSLLWTTHVGGNGNDLADAVAIDQNGNPIITGNTFSDDLVGATNQYFNSRSTFVTKLDGQSGSIGWSTYSGGSSHDYGYALAVDGQNNVLVTGRSNSTHMQWSTTSHPRGSKVTLAKFDSETGHPYWTTAFGGSRTNRGYAISVDLDGKVVLAGDTTSTYFPGMQNENHGRWDVFVMRLDPSIIPAPPAIVAHDSYAVMAGTVLSVNQASGLVANDQFPAGIDPNQIVTELVSPALHGNVQLSANGSFSYVPLAGFQSYDSFTYRVFNGTSYSSKATVLIQVFEPIFHSSDAPKTILDATGSGARQTNSILTISDTQIAIDQLTLNLWLTHQRPDDLSGFLVSPQGTQVQLFDRVTNIPTSFDVSGSFHGQQLDGTWTLELWDHRWQRNGTLNAWSLTVVPQPESIEQTFDSTDTPLAIVDATRTAVGTTQSFLAISESITIDTLTLNASLTHQRNSDLSGLLIHPDGTQVQLFDRVHTIPSSFNLPHGFQGKSVQGSWELRIIDHRRQRTGKLQGWSITVTRSNSSGMLGEGEGEAPQGFSHVQPSGHKGSPSEITNIELVFPLPGTAAAPDVEALAWCEPVLRPRVDPQEHHTLDQMGNPANNQPLPAQTQQWSLHSANQLTSGNAQTSRASVVDHLMAAIGGEAEIKGEK